MFALYSPLYLLSVTFLFTSVSYRYILTVHIHDSFKKRFLLSDKVMGTKKITAIYQYINVTARDQEKMTFFFYFTLFND